LPGIPGDNHAPGSYLVDYDTRTIRSVPTEDTSGPTEPLPDLAQPEQAVQPLQQVDITAEVAHLESEIQTLSAGQQQQA
jgi:hypothetical protein